MTESKKKSAERYARLMGGFWRNPKVRRLSIEARGVLAMAWSYAADEMTNGDVPVELLAMWSGRRWAAIRSELTARHPEANTSRGEPFLVMPEAGGIDAKMPGFLEHNISREDWAQRKADAAARQAESRKKKAGGDANVTRDIARDVTRDVQGPSPCDSLDEGRRTKDEEDPGAVAPGGVGDPAAASPAGPTDSDRIADLGARYPAALLAAVYDGCTATRKRGRMADSVWAETLAYLADFPLDAAVRAMTTYVEKHADGSKGESYLKGIARGERDRPAGASASKGRVVARQLPTQAQYAADATTDAELEGWGLIPPQTDEEWADAQRSIDQYAKGALHG